MTVCLTAISTLYFADKAKYRYGYPVISPNSKIGGFGRHGAYEETLLPLHHSTTLMTTWSKPTKKHHPPETAEKAEDFTKTNTKWLSNEADENEIASNSILDGTQYASNGNAKKNETRPFTEPIITKDGKNKNNVYNFKGDSPHEAEEAAVVEEKPQATVHFKELKISRDVGLPEFCDSLAAKDPQLCQSVCCDESAQGLEHGTCFEETGMSSDLKYNVSQGTQEEVPIDIKDVTHLSHNDEVLENLNVSSHVDVPPLGPKENDELEQDMGCYTVNLILRANTFNTTLNTQEICSGDLGAMLAIEVPVSRYMRETQIELLFLNPERRIKEWTICDQRDRSVDFSMSLDASGNQIYQPIIQRELTKPSFTIQIPQFGAFERYMEFRTLLKSTTKNICQLTHDTSTLFMQYNIRLYRDCS